MSQKLYLIEAYDDNGESLDALVVANDKQQAAEFWRVYFTGQEASLGSFKIGEVPGVTPTREVGVIPWEEITSSGD